MIIGIDGNEANIEKRVGVHQYAYELLCELHNIRRNSKNKQVCFSKNNQSTYEFLIYLKGKPIKNLPKQNSWWKYIVIPGKSLWIMTKLMPHLLLTSNKPDVFFTPSHYLPPIITIPSVCTIHDLGYLKFSEQFKKYDFWQLKYWTAISLYISKYIISVSKSTKKDIVRHYHFASNKTQVVYHGLNKKRFNNKIKPEVVRRVKDKYSISGQYILFLSTLKPSKNIEGILDAFSNLYQDNKMDKSIKLVIAGKKGWLFEPIFDRVKKLNIGNNVIFTDFVSENDKPALLKGARVLISPSFWEGFGLHLLEALACGTPVIVSSVASVPEVVGDAGIYVNPESTESISGALYDVLAMNEVEYDKLVNKGLSQAGKFSWKVSAQKTLDILEKAANGNI